MGDLWLDRYLPWILEEELRMDSYDIDIGMMRRLHSIEFVWTIDKDRRRAADGLALRKRYPAYDDMSRSLKMSPCSVLEMLAALAIRIDKEWIGNARENRAYIPFEDMIANLRLTPRNFYGNINDWMLRRFQANGKGSIFPLRRPDCDQREVEIWSQMVRYIDEKY